ncbi:MAG: SDR family oxidoreductase, partial [Vicinamibacterales bacterium]
MSLRHGGSRVVEVRRGDRFERVDDAHVTVAAYDAAEYERVLRAVAAESSSPITLVHLCGVTDGATGLDEALDLGFYSLVALAQGLARLGAVRPMRLVVVTTRVQSVVGDEVLDPAKAATLGPCRVIPQEVAQVHCTHVDLERASGLDGSRLAMLCDEIRGSREPVVALRGAHRWTQSFEPERLVRSGRKTVLRERGVYLITGGTGGIGLTLAEHLAESVRGRVVLMGRTPLPDRSEWAGIAAGRPVSDPLVARIRRIEAIERLGGEVLVAAGDVTSADDLAAVIALTRERFGTIDGVIHAAGVPGGGLIALKTRAAAAAVLAPKVQGLFALDRALGSAPLDFLMLCSSLHAVVGGLGQVDYAAANAVLDAYAQQRWARGDVHVVSIDWDAWREVGMAVSTPVPEDIRQRRDESLRNAIAPAEGRAVFDAVVGCGLPQVTVYTQDFDALLAAAAAPPASESEAGDLEAPPRPSHPRPALPNPFVASRTPLERTVCEVFERVLGIDQVGVHDNFFDLGGHSLLTVDILARLRRQVGIDLPVARLYEGEALSPAFVAVLLEQAQSGPAAATTVSADNRDTNTPPFHEKRRRPSAEDVQEVRVMGVPRTTDRADRGAMAIIGMSARFPGAPSIEAFWRNLRDGVESRRVHRDEDLKAEGFSDTALRHPRLVKSGFVLDDIDKFDASFFGINPREAELLDPQHRLFLECAWSALENAGYDGDTYDGAIAVFGGATMSGYLNHNILKNANVWATVGPRQAIYGSVPDYMVTRVSYKLNLKGPCYFVQSACSTSLVAVHLGCQSLQNHECDVALAGGVSVQVPHTFGYIYEDGGMMSPDGVCRTFDANARGTVFGSGVGLVVLKRLEDAIADGDTIRAIIRGTATNNDGSLKVGFTAPSVVGQAQVVSEALANAGVSADSINYVEAHGTGTELGDPIEVAALTRAYRTQTDRRAFCALGSVKPNIGHLDAAAGISSLIKTVLALEHGQLPPTINFERPNPKIDFESSPFYVNTALAPWHSNGGPRRAGVSSFGFGGTNAHVIVEEAPRPEQASSSRTQQLVVLSAKSETALSAAASALAEDLRRRPNVPLAEMAYTLQVGRRAFAHRRAIVCGTTQETIDALEGGDLRRVFNGFAAASDRTAVFLFPGQGTQYVGMGRDLYAEEPVFRDVVDECCEQLAPALGVDLRDVLYPAEATDERSERLKRTSLTQAALFAVEYATARLWMSWGVKPAACIGHSVGEFVAACVSGVLQLPDALRLVALRGRLMEQMPEGLMAAVPLPENRVQPMLGPGLWLAAINAPSLCVVSGEPDRVNDLVTRLAGEGVECRLLHTSHAFHSGMMDAAVAPFAAEVGKVDLGAPEIPYLSNVTGDWATESLVSQPEYWGRHIRQAVRFSDGVAQLLQQSD